MLRKDNKGQDMKKELIEFLDNHPLFKYELDGGSESQVRNALDQFFDQYQPERSKREDGNLERSVDKLTCKECGKDVLYLSEIKRETVSCRCGALNSMET